VRDYAQDMIDGWWLLSGKTIILDETGAVLNGQHRLLACIKADRAFETWLVEGVDVTSGTPSIRIPVRSAMSLS
jgi:hypothetical protein